MSAAESPDYPARRKYVAETAESYLALREDKPRWLAEQTVLRDFVAELPEGSRLLDVPFGTGRFAEIYETRGLKVAGVDISADMLKQARQGLGARTAMCDLLVAEAERLPFADGSFDVVVCHRFLKWLPDAAALDLVIGELARVARGSLLLHGKVDSAGRTIRQMLARAFGARRRRGAARTRGFLERQYRRAFAKAGLRVVRQVPAPGAGRDVVYFLVAKIAARDRLLGEAAR